MSHWSGLRLRWLVFRDEPDPTPHADEVLAAAKIILKT